MKKCILTITLIAIASLAWSQQRNQEGRRPERPSSEEMIKQATKALSLTDEQVIQWTDIHEKYESGLKDESKAHKTMQAMGKELEATLSEEQLKKFKEMRPKKGPPRGGK